MTKQFKGYECCNPNCFEKTEAGGLFFFWSNLHRLSIEILNSFALYMMLAKQNFSFCVRFAVPYATFLNTNFHGKLVANGLAMFSANYLVETLIEKRHE